MCIILYEDCTRCLSHEKFIVRCIGALSNLTHAPCAEQHNIEPPPRYSDKHLCVSCAIETMTTDDLNKYLYHQSHRNVHLTMSMTQLPPNRGYVCRI